MARPGRGSLTPRRRAKGRRQHRRFLIVTEGSSTEVDYFEACRPLFRERARVQISHDASSPNKVVAEAIRIKEQDARAARTKQDPEDVYDDVWCVLDLDEHATLRSALRDAERNGISVAISSPCFEVWLILHVADQRAALATSRKAKERWRMLAQGIPSSSKSNSGLVTTLPEAIARADRLDVMHARNGTPRLSRNPSTEIHRLLRALAQRAGVDIEPTR